MFAAVRCSRAMTFRFAVLVSSLLVGCTPARAPEGTRVLVEATVVEGDATTLAAIDPHDLGALAGKARAVTSSHVLVKDGVAATIAGPDPSRVALEIAPRVVDDGHVSLGVTTTTPDASSTVVVADHEPTVVAPLRLPERAVVVEATIVRSDDDLRRALERKKSRAR